MSPPGSVIFGGGSFLRISEIFRATPGVTQVTIGYCGGNLDNPTEAEVRSDTTGHAEVARVEYNPAVVGFDELLDLFWSGHDPTTINQQGSEIGTRFRSVIYCTTEAHLKQAFASRERLRLTGRYRRAIVTEIAMACDFWPASVNGRSHHDSPDRT